MKISHIHLSFVDLKNAVQWMKKILLKDPGYQNDNMAVFSFENLEYVFDQGEKNTDVTIALGSINCEVDFKTLSTRGAATIELPSTQPWGVKTAYIKGPGAVVFEVEEVLK